jgi:hypothetical protein
MDVLAFDGKGDIHEGEFGGKGNADPLDAINGVIQGGFEVVPGLVVVGRIGDLPHTDDIITELLVKGNVGGEVRQKVAFIQGLIQGDLLRCRGCSHGGA